MGQALAISLGQYSEAGLKPVNQDFHGAMIPDGDLLASRGIALAIADGISTSTVSEIAAETAVKSFLTDYYCTSESWPVKLAGGRVIAASNSWLCAQGRAEGVTAINRGYVCTFSALVLLGREAHLFHVGDSRISRLRGERLEPLTEDHRRQVSSHQSYLARALGARDRVEIDYRRVGLRVGDVFVLSTDGVHEVLAPQFIARTIRAATSLEGAARDLVRQAIRRGSDDNCTIQICRIDAVPPADDRVWPEVDMLPVPPPLEPPCVFEGWMVLQEVSRSPRSLVYLAQDPISQSRAVLKLPGPALAAMPARLRRFAMEDWIARRIASPHVVSAHPSPAPKTVLHNVMELVVGERLRQWIKANPRPDLAQVRRIIMQLAEGLEAIHARGMLHRDLRPGNVIITPDGRAVILDFGMVHIPGVQEARPRFGPEALSGAARYAAPELVAGDAAGPGADQFSLAVIAYEMLSGGGSPFTAAGRYQPLRKRVTGLSGVEDQVLRRALHRDPARRFASVTAFAEALSGIGEPVGRAGFWRGRFGR